MKKILIILTVSLSITLFYFATSNSNHNDKKYDERVQQYYQNSKQACQQDTRNCQNYEISKLAVQGDLTKAINMKNALLKKDLIDINQCHNISHFIGEISYYKYGLIQTLKKDESGCLQGIYHGAIFQYVKNLKTNIDVPKLRVICNLSNSNKQDQQICIHGVGHAFIYSKDLKYGVNKCAKVFDQRAQGVNNLDNYFSCIGGVFASELNKNPNHMEMKIDLNSITTYLKDCESFEQVTRKVCVSFYAMEGLGRSVIEPTKLLDNCLGIKNYELDCAKGVGISYANYYSIDLADIINFCILNKNDSRKTNTNQLYEEIISACLTGFKSSLFLKTSQ